MYEGMKVYADATILKSNNDLARALGCTSMRILYLTNPSLLQKEIKRSRNRIFQRTKRELVKWKKKISTTSHSSLHPANKSLVSYNKEC